MSGNPICPRCQKAVYFAEKINANGKDYHKACLKCTRCNKKLEPGNFSDKEGSIYCNPCYGSIAGPKGYGFSNTLDSHER